MVGLRKDGSELWVGIAVALVDLADGPASIAFMHDITASRRMEEEREITLRLLRVLDAESDLPGMIARGVAADASLVGLRRRRISPAGRR